MLFEMRLRMLHLKMKFFCQSGFIFLSPFVAALIVVGCNPGQYIERPNAEDDSGTRISSRAPLNNPVGTDTAGNINESTRASLFEADVSIAYYAAVNATTQLEGILIARHKTDKKILRITAPNLNNGQVICLMTGVEFSSDPYGVGSFFLDDLSERRCGSVPNGEGVFTMARDEFNVITVIFQSDLDAFSNWATNPAASSDSYPSMSQGLIDDLMPFQVWASVSF